MTARMGSELLILINDLLCSKIFPTPEQDVQAVHAACGQLYLFTKCWETVDLTFDLPNSHEIQSFMRHQKVVWCSCHYIWKVKLWCWVYNLTCTVLVNSVVTYRKTSAKWGVTVVRRTVFTGSWVIFRPEIDSACEIVTKIRVLNSTW